MSDQFTCFLYRPYSLTPDLRVLSSTNRAELAAEVMREVRTWGAIDKVEVVDEQQQVIFTMRPG